MKNIYSFSEFYGFLQALPDLDIVPEATARNLKESSLRMLNVATPSPDADVCKLDVEIVASQYELTSDADVSQATIQSYKSRLQSAIQKFIDYQNKKFGVVMVKNEQCEPILPRRRRRVTSTEVKKDATVEAVKTFELPIPIRDGLVLKVDNLPMDLSYDEAERIATIIKSFAIK